MALGTSSSGTEKPPGMGYHARVIRLHAKAEDARLLPD